MLPIGMFIFGGELVSKNFTHFMHDEYQDASDIHKDILSICQNEQVIKEKDNLLSGVHQSYGFVG